MKTRLHLLAIFALTFFSSLYAQDVTTVRANNSDISDNLDLRAIASIFGESRDLEDFERRLNDPDIQISNLDFNNDNQVDYLRVIEAAERNTHLIIIQAVLGADLFQDVATVEVEKDRRNNVQVQVVGDTYLYGNNYIYEPVYVSRPVIYDVFWVSSYRPYYSPWYWGYYPTYYSYWAPYPVYRYRNNIHVHINSRNTYSYVNSGRSSRAVALHNSRRANGYERQYPQNSFARRNSNVSNRYALEQSRTNSSGLSRRADSSGSISNGGRTGTRNSFTNSSVVNRARSTNNSHTSGSRNTTNTLQRSNQSATVRSSGTRNSEPSTSRTSAVRRETAAPSTVRSNPAPQRQTAPVRQSAPAMRSNPAPQRQAAPAVSAPVRSSAPVMRNSAPATQRQNIPAGSGRRN